LRTVARPLASASSKEVVVVADAKRTHRSKSSDAPNAGAGFGDPSVVRFEIGGGMRVLSVSTLQVSIDSVEGPSGPGE
jgi:hypothetical protein